MAKQKSKKNNKKGSNGDTSSYAEEKKDDELHNNTTNGKNNGVASTNGRTTTTTTTTPPTAMTKEEKDKQSTVTTTSKNENEKDGTTTTTSSSLQQQQQQQQTKKATTTTTAATKKNIVQRIIQFVIRTMVVDCTITIIFALYVSTFFLQTIDEEYLIPQLELMTFAPDQRDLNDVTYYHRICTDNDLTTTNVNDLIIDEQTMTPKDASNHMLYHGASMYKNLISKETATILRNFIVKENKKRTGWYVIENENRYSWGIDVNMHPAFHTYWKELASNTYLIQSLEEILGPNPAIVEFTAITSSYGAVDQFDHQDVVPQGNGAKYGRSFIPTYSLFIPLQDVTTKMGATHICPGSHPCSEGCEDYCLRKSFPLSGNTTWPLGWGALVNQQTTHKGMAHTDPNGPDRVLLIATFAPQPTTKRGIAETRMIGQGGSYSLLWSQWGHTFHDYSNANIYMTEPQKTLRSLGLIKGRGINWISVTSMRIANEDNGYGRGELEDFVQSGGFNFLPKAWKPKLNDDDLWHDYLYRSVEYIQDALKQINILLVCAYIVAITFVSHMYRTWSIMIHNIKRLLFLYTTVLIIFYIILNNIKETNWAKHIKSNKSYRLPEIDTTIKLPDTLPLESDILISPHYASEMLGSYKRLLDFIHPGNKHWKELTKANSKGYMNLTTNLKKQLSNTMIHWIEIEEHRRFLLLNPKRRWSRVRNKQFLSNICHVEFIMSSNPLLEVLIRTLDHLWAETGWGLFHDKVIHKTIIPSYLEKWDDIIVGGSYNKQTKQQQDKDDQILLTLLNNKNKNNNNNNNINNDDEIITFEVPITTTSTPTTKIEHAIIIRPSLTSTLLTEKTTTVPKLSSQKGLPPKNPSSITKVEPFPGAWTQAGDVVEAMYQCSYNEWYRGTVPSINPRDGYVAVRYADGELDRTLRRNCVRPFKPYQIGEDIQMRHTMQYQQHYGDNSGAQYYDGRIVKIYQPSSNNNKKTKKKNGGDEEELYYDVQTTHIGYHRRVHQGDLRRVDKNPKVMSNMFQIGTLVDAKFNGEEEWFPGYIHNINPDRTYVVHYDDGDIEENVLLVHLRLRVSNGYM